MREDLDGQLSRVAARLQRLSLQPSSSRLSEASAHSSGASSALESPGALDSPSSSLGSQQCARFNGR